VNPLSYYEDITPLTGVG